MELLFPLCLFFLFCWLWIRFPSYSSVQVFIYRESLLLWFPKFIGPNSTPILPTTLALPRVLLHSSMGWSLQNSSQLWLLFSNGLLSFQWMLNSSFGFLWLSVLSQICLPFIFLQTLSDNMWILELLMICNDPLVFWSSSYFVT